MSVRTPLPMLRVVWREKWMLGGAWWLLWQARVALSLKGFGDPRTNCGAICDGPPAGDGLARRTAWSIDAAARLVPKATCLVRAMAARRLLALKARSSTIRIGVRGGAAGDFEAHAWLVSGDVIVVGGSETELRGFSPIIGAPS